MSFILRRLRRLWQWFFHWPTCCECGTRAELIVWLDKKGPLDWVCYSCAKKLHYERYIPTLFEDL